MEEKISRAAEQVSEDKLSAGAPVAATLDDGESTGEVQPEESTKVDDATTLRSAPLRTPSADSLAE